MTLSRRAVTPAWTGADQLVATLRRRWDAGVYLKAYAAGEPWQTVTLPVKGPGAADLLERLDAARSWLARFKRDARHFCVEHREVRSRNLGTNLVPARVTVPSFEQLCLILGTASDVQVLDALLARTRSVMPALVGWVVTHPTVALQNAAVWEQMLATVTWIEGHDTTRVYLRQMDVEGVDTKFVERHHKLLDHLLTVVLPAERIDQMVTPPTFTRKFRFLDKPTYTRFRTPDSGPAGYTEMTVRTDELARRDPGISTVFVVENEVTYLAFRTVPDAIVVFGSGFALGGVTTLPWLADKEVAYWGDIDTHGFEILDRLRSRLPSVRSILMDHQTLLKHRAQWVSEPAPTNRSLTNLTVDEHALYRNLVEGTFGPSLRLEQERVRFALLHDALLTWHDRQQQGAGDTPAQSTPMTVSKPSCGAVVVHSDPPDGGYQQTPWSGP